MNGDSCILAMAMSLQVVLEGCSGVDLIRMLSYLQKESCLLGSYAISSMDGLQ